MGEIAMVVGCSPTTVTRWVDSGQLTAYRLPGRRAHAHDNDRRVLRADLLEFARARGVRPLLEALEPPAPPPGPVALCGLPDALAGRLVPMLLGRGDMLLCQDLMRLGLAFARTPPPRAVVLGGCHGRAAALDAVRALAGLDPRPLLVGLPGEDDMPADWTAAGFDSVFQLPCDAKRVAEVLA
jgi:excisionase family DNA binding protein